jgi:PKD repeat protein
MSKKATATLIGLALFVSPLVVSAQSAPTSPAALIAIYTQLIQLLEQEIALLTAALAHQPQGHVLTFSAFPTQGAAPLTVTFQSNVSATVNFGDGQSGMLTLNGSTYTTPHTYTSAGTYTVTSGSASVTIVVTAPQNQNVSFTVSPTSGPAPLSVNFTAVDASGHEPSGTIDFGDGNSSFYPAACGHTGPCGKQHTYSPAGTYVARLLSPDQLLGIVTVTVTPQQASCTHLDCLPGYHPSGPSCSPTQTCIPDAAASCTFNGQTITSGSSVTAYQSSFVPAGVQCLSETRTCTNGALAGSYQYVSCTVQSGGTTDRNCTLNILGAPVFPLGGPAPLAVTFATAWSEIDFGDGAIVFPGDPLPGSNTTGCVRHTYLTPGTYTATISSHILSTTTSNAVITVGPTGGTGLPPSCTIGPFGGEQCTVNPSSSCTFASTPEGSWCGGFLHCGYGVNGEYWTTQNLSYIQCVGVASAKDQYANLASALTALEAALQNLLKTF